MKITCPHCGYRIAAGVHVQSQDARCEPYDVLDHIAGILAEASSTVRSYPDVQAISAAVQAAGGRARS